MKKVILLLLIVSILLSLFVQPEPAMAHGGYGWFLPGMIIGGAIGLSMVPRYYYPPYYYYYPRPYYYPPPAYYYPPPPPSYPPPPPNYPPPESSYTAPESRNLTNQSGQKPQTGGQLFIYPRMGQTQEKMEADRNECHAWALGQTGYDPTKPPPNDLNPDQIGQMSLDYQRALGACLDGRGYTVR
jgi:hypothetical protein